MKKKEREKKALTLRKEERTIDFTASSLSSAHPFRSALSVAHKLISTCPHIELFIGTIAAVKQFNVHNSFSRTVVFIDLNWPRPTRDYQYL